MKPKCLYCDAYFIRIEKETLYGTYIFYECTICEYTIKERVLENIGAWSKKQYDLIGDPPKAKGDK